MENMLVIQFHSMEKMLVIQFHIWKKCLFCCFHTYAFTLWNCMKENDKHFFHIWKLYDKHFLSTTRESRIGRMQWIVVPCYISMDASAPITSSCFHQQFFVLSVFCIRTTRVEVCDVCFERLDRKLVCLDRLDASCLCFDQVWPRKNILTQFDQGKNVHKPIFIKKILQIFFFVEKSDGIFLLGVFFFRQTLKLEHFLQFSYTTWKVYLS